MKCEFVTALYKIEIPENLGRGDKLSETMFITNDRNVISKLVHSGLVPMIGLLERDAILTANAVIYATDEIGADLEPGDHLKKKLFEVAAFLNAMWLADDNAVNQEMGFLFYRRDSQPSVDSNFLPLRYSGANGNEDSFLISRDVLRAVRKFSRETLELEERPFEKSSTKLVGKIPRLSRALYLVQQARVASDLAVKIAIYCSAFESLFATSLAELSHQLAERIACFLEIDLLERLQIYRSIKKAYSVRSKIVHGDVLKPSIVEKLPTTSEECDNLLRRSLVKIFSEPTANKAFESASEKLDEYLLSQIFGRSADQ